LLVVALVRLVDILEVLAVSPLVELVVVLAVLAVVGWAAVATAARGFAGRELGLGFGADLGSRAAWDVGVLAIGVPGAAGDRLVIESDQVAQLVELLL
jgi:hypothetical protein